MAEARLRAVLFDAVGTLIRLREPVGETYARFAARARRAIPAGRLEEAFAALPRGGAARWSSRASRWCAAEALERAWWRRLVVDTFRAADGTAHASGLRRVLRRALAALRRPPRPGSSRPERGRRSSALRRRGLATGIVSNFDQRLRPVLRGLAIHHLFHAIVLPAEIGAAKPDRAIFDAALKRLGLAGEQVAYVGDRAARGRRRLPGRGPAPDRRQRPCYARRAAACPRARGRADGGSMSDVPAPLRLVRERYGLAPSDLESVLGAALARGADYADVFLERTTQDSVALEDGIVKSGDRHLAQGVGVRGAGRRAPGLRPHRRGHPREPATRGGQPPARSPRGAARRASVAIRASGRPLQDLYPLATAPTDVPVAEKIELLSAIDCYARRRDPRVAQVMASVVSQQRLVLVAGSDGTFASDVQPLVRVNVQVIAEDGRGRREVAYQGGGGRVELAVFLDPARWQPLVDEAVRLALLNLAALPCPAGTMDVVLAPGWSGVLLHEAVGHGLEGDFNRKGTSAFAGRIGERVAAPGVTVVDDGTLPGRRGSLNVDDEGQPTQRNVLIEDGILRGLSPGSAQRAPDGRACHGQRAPRELRPPAAAPHDQHLHARRPGRSRGDRALRRPRPLRGELRRRPGGHHERQVRVLGERGLPDRGRPPGRAREGGLADRERPRSADARAPHRRRSRARPGRRHLRQGRPVRSRRGRAPDACWSRTSPSEGPSEPRAGEERPRPRPPPRRLGGRRGGGGVRRPRGARAGRGDRVRHAAAQPDARPARLREGAGRPARRDHLDQRPRGGDRAPARRRHRGARRGDRPGSLRRPPGGRLPLRAPGARADPPRGARRAPRGAHRRRAARRGRRPRPRPARHELPGLRRVVQLRARRLRQQPGVLRRVRGRPALPRLDAGGGGERLDADRLVGRAPAAPSRPSRSRAPSAAAPPRAPCGAWDRAA